jgi:predicted nucleic acid-binding protein
MLPDCAQWSAKLSPVSRPRKAASSLLLAQLMAEGKAAGRPRSGLDVIVAATAGANDCIVVTDNEKDFAGIQFVNPCVGRPDAATD